MKMKRIKNRLLSLVLMFSMTVGVLPASTAYAQEQTGTKSMSLWGDADPWDDSGLWSDDAASDNAASDSLFNNGNSNGSLFDSDEDEDSLFEGEADDDITNEDEVVLSAEDDDIKVDVSGSADALAGIESVSIEDVTDENASDYAEYLNDLDDGWTYSVPGVYDITLYDEDGNEAEPDGEVTVSLSGYAVESSVAGKNQVRIYHDELSGIDAGISTISTFSMRGDQLDEEFMLEEMDSYVEDMEAVTFTTDSFSKYALVLAGNDSQKEFEFGDKTYFEMDKYLQKTGEMNGQDSYDIYLEHAFYDGSGTSVKSYAPGRSDIMLALDQSSSVAPYVDTYNDAVETLLRTIAKTNQDREAQALAGEYYDIDPKNVTTDADMKKAMKNHYMYIAGVVGFNNHLYNRHVAYSNPTLLITDEDVENMINICHINNDLKAYQQGDSSAHQQLGTRTDLATQQLLNWAKAGNWKYTYKTASGTQEHNSLCCVLITDGAPTGSGRSWPSICISAASTNKALGYAYSLKREVGAMNFGIYVPFHNMDDASVAKAFSSGRIRDLVFGMTDDNDVITLGFLSMWSSDYPANGKFKTVSGDPYSGNFTGDFDVYSEDDYGRVQNGFGKYIYADQSYPDLIGYVDSVVNRIDVDAFKGTNSRGYFGKDTIMQDEITDPFDIVDKSNIRVYAVPRIPKNLGADGIPTDMDDETKEVSAFRWGDRLIPGLEDSGSSEWTDITDDVILNVQGSMIKVTGYDFEYNAVTDFDKDIIRYEDDDDRSNGLVYKTGDYGYKVVVIVPICSKFSFGGNGIRTNNEDTSGVIPSVPDKDNPNPVWEENNKLNPDGDKFVGKYPSPKVDLKVNYEIVKDNVTIYAPQTEELHDLLTDSVLNQIWYTDMSYFDLKGLRDSAKEVLTAAYQRYNLALSSGSVQEELEAEQALSDARTAYQEAQAALDTVVAYIPNGINNAFVNIDYTFSDPDGKVLATLNVPHGKAFYYYKNGDGNIDWNISTDGQILNERGNPIITKSGKYTINATVTPVNTTQSPDWHVHSEADDETTKATYPNDSQEYSPTGSSASGSQSALTITEYPEAYVFTLELTTVDSRREVGQAIDFREGSGAVRDIVERADNKHITGYRWVCTDGKTESIKENEPGVTGLVKVGSDAMLTSVVPEQAYTDGLVKTVADVTTVTGNTGEFVPVNVLVSRTVGDLNKSVDSLKQMEQHSLVMTDNDNIYGDGISSVKWIHECNVITDWDCNDSGKEYEQANDKYGDVEEIGRKGKIRYLMHIYENPEPDVTKSTTTPVIAMGSNIDWTITLANTNTEKNKNMLTSEFTMVDVLPWVGDERIDPNYGAGRDGSKFSGTLFYRSMTVDFADASHGGNNMSVYYTEDIEVRDATDNQLTGAAAGITWIKADSYEVSSTCAGFYISDKATAIRVDTILDWKETMTVALTANVTDPLQQQIGDYYHNAAWIAQGKGTIVESNVVSTQVSNIRISGTVWEDSDTDGLMLSTEPMISNVRISLYKLYDPMNPNAVVRTIDGIKLTNAYDVNYEKLSPVITDSRGRYEFVNVQSGTYYIVADLIPEKYDMTKQRAGAGNAQDAMIDSEAETTMIKSGENLEKTAWIKAVEVTSTSADYQNFGLQAIAGNIRVGKVVNEIYYPSAMTEEEREDYRINCTFTLRNMETGTEYKRTVYLKEDDIRLKDGLPQVWAEFNDLPLGTYELTEQFDPNYHLADVKHKSNNVSFDSNTGKVTVKVTADDFNIDLWMENVARPDPPAGDENGINNPIKIKKPIKLEVIYSGPDPISSDAEYEYTFTESDFDHNKPATDGSDRSGDIIVTYDDGSQIKLSDGSLKFDSLTFNPKTLDSSMNSSIRRTTVAVYYSERGHLVRDSFSVRVDLKPFFKFKVRFFGNSSTFDTNEEKNQVNFVYNDLLGYNEVTSGIYKDVKNKGLKQLSGFWQCGWNTSEDGMGTQYGDENDALTPLNKIGQEKKLNTLDLYANWKTNVTFNANGGTLTGGTANWETAAAGKSSVTQPFSKNQSIMTSLIGTRPGYIFLFWNTKPDGTGEELTAYNKSHNGCQGPVTFYAIYLKSDYWYTGSQQIFTAPISGWYKVQLWGAKGGGDSYAGGAGGYAEGEIKLTVGQSIYVYVGEPGYNIGINKGGYNGGGTGVMSGGGGGATDIRTIGGAWNASASLKSRIIVAGAGGGGAMQSAGGYGGGLVGGNSSGGGYGGTQTSGGGYSGRNGRSGGFGVGASPGDDAGGGGGGWYGGGAIRGGDDHKEYDRGGGGGSSYIGGYGSIIPRNARTIAGNQQMPDYDGGMMTGNKKPCLARFTLVEKTTN